MASCILSLHNRRNDFRFEVPEITRIERCSLLKQTSRNRTCAMDSSIELEEPSMILNVFQLTQSQSGWASRVHEQVICLTTVMI